MKPNRPLLFLLALWFIGTVWGRADECGIASGPANATVEICHQATFSLVLTGSPLPTVQWYRNGTPIAGAVGPVYRTPPVAQSDNGSVFWAVAGTATCTSTSQVATLAVIADTTAPSLQAVAGDCSSRTVKVVFNELVDLASAQEPFNYTLTGSAFVTEAVLQADGRTVLLSVNFLQENTAYTLFVSGVMDQCGGNSVAANTSFTFTTPGFVIGNVLRQWWHNLPGSSLAALTGLPGYPGNPDEFCYTNRFELNSAPQGTNYGARLTAWFVPPISGIYHFYLAAGGQAELALSPDANPNNLQLIASEPVAAPFRRDWLGADGRNAAAPENRSSTLFPNGFNLVAGQRYAMQAVLKVAFGPDHLAVAVQTPDQAPPENGAPPIPGAMLASCLEAGTNTLFITQQPVSLSTLACSNVCWFVSGRVDGVCGLLPEIQWQRFDGNLFTDIPGAWSELFCLPTVSAADNGAQFRARLSFGGQTNYSQTATLTVLQDTNPPALVSVQAFCGSNQLVVRFSEPVDPAAAINPANYTLVNSQGMPIPVLQALMTAGNQSVVLDTATLAFDPLFTLSVRNIVDACGGNPIGANDHLDFQCVEPVSILLQPESVTVSPGETASFSVQAGGAPPLAFQWFKDGLVIPGADRPTLTISNAQFDHVGRYQVRVAGSNSVVFSFEAELALLHSYSLSLPAGLALIANQLYQSNQLLSTVMPFMPDGASLQKWDPVSQSLIGPDVFVSGAGWTGTVGGPSSTKLSPGEGALLFLPVPHTLVFQGAIRPPSLPLNLFTGYNLVSRQVPRPATYQDITGLPPFSGAVVDQYRPFTDDYSTRIFLGGQWRDRIPVARVGEAVWMSQLEAPFIFQQPQSQTGVSPGATVTFQVEVISSQPLRYQWRRNGVSIPDATNAVLTIPNAQWREAGLYSCAIQPARVSPPGFQPGRVEDLPGAILSTPAALRLLAQDFPFSNDFANRPVLDTFASVLTGNNRFADHEPGEPRHAGKPGRNSVWLAWVAPAGGIVTFSTLGSSFDTLLAAYSGPGFPGVELDADDDRADYLGSRISFNAEQGKTYNVVVDGFAGSSGDFVLEWILEPTTGRLPVIVTHPQSRLVELGTPAQLSVTATGQNLVYQWYRDGVVIPDAVSNVLSIALVQDFHVGSYSVEVGNGSRSVMSRSALLQARPAGSATLGSLPKDGEPDLLALDKFSDVVAATTNSSLLGPAKVGRTGKTVAHGFSGTQIFSTLGATKEPDEMPHCGVRGGKSEWFTYQPTNHGTLKLDTDGSSFDTVLAVYVGPGDSFLTLTNVACDNNSGLDGRDSSLVLNVTSNTIYYIAVDGVNNPSTGVAASGTVRLNYRMVLPLILTNISYAVSLNYTSAVLKVVGTPNVAAIVQSATDPAALTWISLYTNTPAGGSFSYTNTNAVFYPQRYYRAVHEF